jgi:hypothetical protein
VGGYLHATARDPFVLAVLIVVAIVTAAAAVVLVGVGRSRHFSDIDRFHRASAMTTEWARQGVTAPPIVEERPDDDGEPAARRERRA